MKRSTLPLVLVLGVVMLLLGALNAFQVYAALLHRPQSAPLFDAAPVFLASFGALLGGVYLGRYFSLKGRDNAR